MVSMQIEGYYKKLGKLEGSYELDFNLQTMYQIAKEVLLYTASEIARINEREKGDLIEEIQTFLIKNMDKPQLNMNDVAEQFHISAGYMGRLFKNLWVRHIVNIYRKFVYIKPKIYCFILN